MEFELDFLDASQPNRCTFCFLVKSSLRNFIKQFLAEGTTDPQSHSHWLKNNGLCHTHAWEASEVSQTIPLAVFYKQLLEKNIPFNSKKAGLFESKPKCLSCSEKEKIEKIVARQFIKTWGKEEFRLAFKQKSNLCIPHARLILSNFSNAHTQKEFIACLVAKHREVLSDVENMLAAQESNPLKLRQAIAVCAGDI